MGLWALHLSDGMLRDTPAGIAVLIGSFLLIGALMGLGAIRLREEEIPRIALLSAVFFIATTIHIPNPVAPIHLLFNGLMGVVLGWRAGAAIFVGLLFQAIFIGHGGFTTLGLNACVLTIPALVFGLGFRRLHRWQWCKHPLGRFALVFVSSGVWMLSAVFSVALLASQPLSQPETVDLAPVWAHALHPLTLIVVASLSLLAAAWERRLENAPEFPLGLLLGEMSVLAALALHTLVLLSFGEMPQASVLVWMLMHLPLAVIEGIIVGITVGFLARVKPELLNERLAIPDYDWLSHADRIRRDRLPDENKFAIQASTEREGIQAGEAARKP